MTHALEIIDGKASMAYAGELPWHGLGTKVPSDLTPEQMMQAAGLDWEVEKTPLYTRYQGDNIRIDKRYALTRSSDGRVLDIVGGDNWHPTQNVAAFEFFNDFVAAGNCTMETAGSLHDGRIVWAMAKINESIEVVKGDVIEGNLLFSNPHKYGKALDIRSTDVRVVCQNTLSLALGDAAKTNYRVDHRQTFNADEAKLAIGIAKEKLLKYKEMGQFLASKRFKDEDVVTYFNRVFNLNNAKTDDGELGSRPARTVMESLWDQPGVEFGEGSFWQLYNAVTYTVDHKLGRSADTRTQSAWFGSGADRKLNALNVAIEMADAM